MEDKFKVGEIVYDKWRRRCKILEINEPPKFKYVLEDWIGIIKTDYVLKIKQQS